MASSNFVLPWCDGAEVLIIVEALQEGCGQYAVVRVVLDGATDVQVLDDVVLMPVSVPVRRDQNTWSWLSLVVFFPVILIRILLEEKELINRFGEEYLDYIQKTKALIPWIW